MHSTVRRWTAGTLWPSLRAFLAITAAASLYEILKHLAFPEIRLWQSHLFTVVVIGATGTIAYFLALRGRTRQLARAAELHHKTESTFRLLFQDNPLPMWVYDLDTLRFLEINDAAVARYGYSPEEFSRLRITDIRPAEEIPRLKADIAAQRPAWQDSGPWQHRLKDGQVIDVQITSHLLPWREHRAVLVIAQDITERKRVMEELHEAKDAAETANRAKSQFLANMSHEIRTPLNGIAGMAQLAIESNSQAEQREYLAMVKSSSDALLAIINDILDFSKIEAGKAELERDNFHLRHLLNVTLKPLAVCAYGKNLALHWEVQPDVPDQVAGDAGRLRQVLTNLVGNSVKFTERGEIDVRVTRTSVEDRRIHLHFHIRDTGIGIPAEKQAAIFDPFTQADGSAARRYGGTGLGLTISRRIVELMGGNIRLESQVGIGSTFHFTVPFDPPVPAPAPPAVEPEVRDPIAKNLRILVAEDNAVNRTLAVRLLEKHGCAVEVAGNGRDALAKIGKAHFDLVLMDVQMPEMDGLEATTALRKSEERTGGHVPIVAMTAHAMKGDEQICLAAGMDAYVSKPIQVAHLFRVIAQLTGGRAAAANESLGIGPVMPL